MAPTTTKLRTVVGFSPLATESDATSVEDDEPTTIQLRREPPLELRETAPAMSVVAAPVEPTPPLYAPEPERTYLFLPPTKRAGREAWLLHIASLVGAAVVATLLLWGLVATSTPRPELERTTTATAAAAAPSAFAPAGAIVAPPPTGAPIVVSAGATSHVVRHLVKEGDLVEEGQALVELDRAPIEEAVTHAQLSLRTAIATRQAAAAHARQSVRAYRDARKLARTQGSSSDDDDGDVEAQSAVRDARDAADAAVAEERAASTAVSVARLALARAKANRNAVVVRAPVSGVVARVAVPVGAQVVADAPLVELEARSTAR